MKAIAATAALIALTGCAGEFSPTPSIFPPVSGAVELPSQASGWYQGTPYETLTPLNELDQQSLAALSPEQRARALKYLRAGSTVGSSFYPD